MTPTPLTAPARRALAVLCALGFAAWLLALAGVAGVTGYACAAAAAGGVRGTARVGGTDLVGGGDSAAFEFLGLANDDTYPVPFDGDGSNGGGRRRLLATPGTFPAENCGDAYRLQFWCVFFHLIVWVWAARALARAPAATGAASGLFSVAAGYATWCANAYLGAAGSTGFLSNLFAGLDALLLAAQPGRRAAAQAASAGFVVLAAVDLAWLFAHVILAERSAAAAAQTQQQSAPPPPPSAVYVYAPAAAAAIASKAEAAEEGRGAAAAAGGNGSDDGATIGTRA